MLPLVQHSLHDSSLLKQEVASPVALQ
jgi:hypothetical protein